MFDPSKPVRTKCGREAKILDTEMGGKWPIAAKVKTDSGWLIARFTSDGANCWLTSSCLPNYLALENIPQEFCLDVWVNVYRQPDGTYVAASCCDKEQADEFRRCGCIACVKVVIKGKEGDGL